MNNHWKREPVEGVLLAFDPGPLTGVAVFREEELVELHTTDSYRGIDALMARHRPAIVVCEAYRTVRLIDGPALDVVKRMGWIEGLCELLGIRANYQLPAERVAYQAIARKAVDMLKLEEPATQHAIDAVAHGLAYLARERARRHRPTPRVGSVDNERPPAGP